MAKILRVVSAWFFLALLTAAFTVLPLMARADDDEPIGLAPVEKGEGKKEEALPTEKVAPTVVPTAVPTPVPAVVPVVAPKPKPKPAHKKPAPVKVLGVTAGMEGDSLVVEIQGSGALWGKTQTLKSPDRVLLKISNAILAAPEHQKDINTGAAQKVRMSQKGGSVWVVVDLSEPVAYKAEGNRHHAYALKFETGGKPGPGPRGAMAQVPKINLMLFDRNVMFQGRQYDRFPCANLIYDETEKFPLEREFVTILVFFQGYGTFVGNLRILAPNGAVVDQTRDPFAFNLFNPLTDYNVETTWKVKFPFKGMYSMVLTLNGEDVLKHEFYVGHNDDSL